MKKSVQLVALAALVTLSGAPVSCTQPGRAEANPSDIHVIVVMPFTGSFRTRSESHRAAIQLAFRDLEEAGGILDGRNLRVWEIDSANDADESEARVRELIQTTLLRPGQTSFGPDTHMVAGIISTTTAAYTGSLRVALELEIPHFEMSSGSHFNEFIPGWDPNAEQAVRDAYLDNTTAFAFATRALCQSEAVMTADFIASRPEWRRVVLMRGTKTHDAIHTSIIRRRLAEHADPTSPNYPYDTPEEAWTGEIVAVDAAYNGNSDGDLVMEYGDNWSEHIRNVATQMGQVDVFFFHLNGDSNNFDFLGQAALLNEEEGVDIPEMVTCAMAEKASLLDPINPGIADWLSRDNPAGEIDAYPRRLWFVGRRPPSDAALSERRAQFATDYESFVGFRPDRWGGGGYDAAIMLGLALASGNRTNTIPRGQELRQRIIDVATADPSGTEIIADYGSLRFALEAAKAGQAINYEGLAGSLEFRQDRTVPGEYMVDYVYLTDEGNHAFETLATPSPRRL